MIVRCIISLNIAFHRFIAYGEKEPLILFRFEANQYALELQKVGYTVSLIEVPYANHFNMINELGNTQGKVLQAVMKMLF